MERSCLSVCFIREATERNSVKFSNGIYAKCDRANLLLVHLRPN
jgi:hypothetical protein